MLKMASNAKRYPLCENRQIPFTRNPPASCLLGRCPNPHRTQNMCSGTMDKSIKKLPTIKALNTEYAELLAEKKAAYADYRKAREEMKELLTAKANIDRILELDKEQEEANERREKEAEQR